MVPQCHLRAAPLTNSLSQHLPINSINITGSPALGSQSSNKRLVARKFPEGCVTLVEIALGVTIGCFVAAS